MTDLCKAGLWDIDPRATCPICGALPNTDCEAQMDSIAEKMALELAAQVGSLAAVVEWCVEHDGECLVDNPRQLVHARKVLADARKHYPPATS